MSDGGLSQAEISALFATATGGQQQEQKQQQQGPQSLARPAAFPNLERARDDQSDPASIGLLANVELEVTVHLGQTRRSIKEILAMGPGSVVELERLAGEPVDILVNGRLVARGEVVVIGEHFGVRIVELLNPAGGPK